MSQNILNQLIEAHKNQPVDFILYLNGNSYQLKDVKIAKLPTPVTKPTTRGGVYFSDKYVYKINGTIYDTTIIHFLSKKMLGPNAQFEDIKIQATISKPNQNRKLVLYGNLTCSMQSSTKVELNLVIVRIEG